VSRRGGVVGLIAAATVVVASLCAAAASGDARGTTGKVTTRPAPATQTTSSATAPRDRPRPWDPRDVDELPDAADDLAPLLPAVIKPPRSARPLAEAPVEAGRSDGEQAPDRVRVVDRRLVAERAGPRALRAREPLEGGTRLLFTQQNDVEVWDLTTGERTSIPFLTG